MVSLMVQVSSFIRVPLSNVRPSPMQTKLTTERYINILTMLKWKHVNDKIINVSFQTWFMSRVQMTWINSSKSNSRVRIRPSNLRVWFLVSRNDPTQIFPHRIIIFHEIIVKPKVFVSTSLTWRSPIQLMSPMKIEHGKDLFLIKNRDTLFINIV